MAIETDSNLLREALGLLDGESPFPWQDQLLGRFKQGHVERALDIPTGLGKTAVMAVWLLARAGGAPLPRRLVYVVDRRAVVDQATEVARQLRHWVDTRPALKIGLGLEHRSLPISTLRGQHVDNREWLDDPAASAIIVGTVDMIGSRLLFRGYRTTPKMRPYQAGLLGADSLIVLDEAHLVPAFESLVATIADGRALYGPRNGAQPDPIPRLALMCLSATGRSPVLGSFGLGAADLADPVVSRRLSARKRLSWHPLPERKELADALAEKAWELTAQGTRPVRCIVFCDKREDAAAAMAAVVRLAGGGRKAGHSKLEVETELFVGGRRVFERETVARHLRELGFIAGAGVERVRPSFVFATSAAEVGVDLDADHMVSDVVAWERMVQRLGRVNRRGNGDAEVVVVAGPERKPSRAVQKALDKPPSDRSDKEHVAIAQHEMSTRRMKALRQLIALLPDRDGGVDVSPGSLRDLRIRAESDPGLQAVLAEATTPPPWRPALSRPLVDAWSMTSLEDHTGRPEVDSWLRGWVQEDPPQTAVVWRNHLPVRTGGRPVSEREIEAFFEAAPPHASEVLETETFRVVEWMGQRAKALAAGAGSGRFEQHDGSCGPRLGLTEVAAIALTPAGKLRRVLKLEEVRLDDEDQKESRSRKEELERTLAGTTLVVDARVCGLKAGLLDDACADPPRTSDDGEEWDPADLAERTGGAPSLGAPVVGFRVRPVDSAVPLAGAPHWRERFRFATEASENGEPSRWLVIEKWRHEAATEEDRSAGRPQLLEEHHTWAEDRALGLARRLGLPQAHQEMLMLAARLHDEGKRAPRWQRAFNAGCDAIYAKTLGPVNLALLDGYRHELGSLLVAASDARLRGLPPDLQDLALHVMVAHHGFARPVIGVNGCEDAPPSVLQATAREVALRFARLQRRWGPWGLAWWEALLRAADQEASRDNDAADLPAGGDS